MRRWAPKYEALKAAYTETKLSKSKRQARHFRCAECEGEFTQKDVQVDHKEPIGSCDTWDEFIDRLFCEAKNLQVLCKPCHKIKTKKERLENQKDAGN
jgi:5-methylcytosine-specific restriction endonuclease McrA